MALGLCCALAATPVWAVPFRFGDVFASNNNGTVQHYDGAGHLLETLDTGQGGFTTGCGFDSSGNLYVTNFAASVSKFEGPDDPHATSLFGGAFTNPESLVFDGTGNAWVSSACCGNIERVDQLGVHTLSLNTGGRADWIDLNSTVTKIFFTEDVVKHVGVLDVASNTRDPDFNGSVGNFALRILPDGGVLVANQEDIKRLDSTGAVVQTYDVAGQDNWFALNIDPDGTSFWSGDFGNDSFFKFDIATGTVLLGPISTGTGGSNLFGLCVFGERTVGRADSNPPICSVTINPGPPPFAHGMAVDNRPSEDTNGNGMLDPGEDLNGNGLIDRDTGIFFVELEPGAVNMTLTVDPFVPGDGTVGYTVTATNPALPAVGIVKATDGAGNTCTSPITLGTFDPFGGIVRTTTRTVTAHVTRPSVNTAGVRCVETTNPANPDFDSIPFTPFSGDSADIEILLSEGDGTKIICCQFIDVQNNISPAVCSEIVLDTNVCPEAQPCDDGNACTTNDTCVGGTCSGGVPPECNDGNICTTDGCNPGTGCTHTSNHTCDGNPKGPGYWRQLCQPPDDGDDHADDHGDDHGTHGGAPPGEFLTQADVDCVNDTCTFASVGTVADFCDRLTPNPGGDKCEKAEAQFMALMLNVCRQRITDGDVTQSHCEGAEDDHSDDDHNGPDGTSTVGEVRSEVDALLCGSLRTEAQCKRAECLAKQINSGEALGVNSLRVEKTANGELKLTWSEPYHTDASLARPRYYIWRREGQSGPFVVQGQTSNLFFVDTTAQNGDYQYEITVIW